MKTKWLSLALVILSSVAALTELLTR